MAGHQAGVNACPVVLVVESSVGPGSEPRSAEEPLAQEDQETRVVIGHYLSLAERLLAAEPEPSAVEEDNQAA